MITLFTVIIAALIVIGVADFAVIVYDAIKNKKSLESIIEAAVIAMFVGLFLGIDFWDRLKIFGITLAALELGYYLAAHTFKDLLVLLVAAGKKFIAWVASLFKKK
jgi:hypothetical protein